MPDNNNLATEILPPPVDTAQVGIRVPADLWLDVRRRALETGVTAQQITIDALRGHLGKSANAA